MTAATTIQVFNKYDEPVETIFSIEEDNLVISSAVAKHQIAFGLLLDDEQKFKVQQSLAWKSFVSQQWLLSQMRLPNAELDAFSSEDYEFAEKVQEIGLPFDIAIRVAYYSNVNIDSNGDSREKFLKHFQEMKHDIRQENTDTYRGLTTLEIYLIIAAYSEIAIADYVVKKSLAEPAKMIQMTRALAEVITDTDLNYIKSEKELAIFLAIVSDDFPRRPQAWEANSGITYAFEAFGKFVQNVPAISSGKASEENEKLYTFLGEHLGGVKREYGSVSYDQELKNLVKLIESKYSEETLKKAFTTFKRNEKYLSDKKYSFFVWTCILEFLHEDGNSDASIDWILALESSIDLNEVLSTYKNEI